MNITTFSKDRACQLDLFLRSVKMFTPFKGMNIIYTFSTAEFKSGYDKIMELYPEFNFILEEDFHNQLIDCIDEDQNQTVFFTDDCIFKSEFKGYILDDPDIGCFSMMLGKNITWAYERNRELHQPSFPSWNWREADKIWNYPMSIVGHIWRTCDVVDKIRKFNCSSPWLLEGSLRDHPIGQPLMTCPNESILVEVAHNVVGPVGNKSGGGSVKELNEKFLKGERIKWEFIDNKSKICEREFEFEGME